VLFLLETFLPFHRCRWVAHHDVWQMCLKFAGIAATIDVQPRSAIAHRPKRYTRIQIHSYVHSEPDSKQLTTLSLTLLAPQLVTVAHAGRGNCRRRNPATIPTQNLPTIFTSPQSILATLHHAIRTRNPPHRKKLTSTTRGNKGFPTKPFDVAHQSTPRSLLMVGSKSHRPFLSRRPWYEEGFYVQFGTYDDLLYGISEAWVE
jgi:hypothetical protein